MADRLIIVTAQAEQMDLVTAVAEQEMVASVQVYAPVRDTEPHTANLLVSGGDRQKVIDRLQIALDGFEGWRITILPVEATIPRVEEPEQPDGANGEGRKRGPSRQTREELYADVARNAQFDRGFVAFVVLSTLVAAIGLIEDNVAVVIGAMVIAPLLGPNLASALGVALGDRELVIRGALTNLGGIAVCISVSVLIALAWPVDLRSDELASRTGVGFDGVVLALASGGAAAVSLTSGLSSALVGVMVAVALLPPAATIGLMLASGHYSLAGGAALLLAVNVVCVNLSAQVAFVLRGVTPRTWLEKQAAARGVRVNATLWLAMLLALALLLLLRARTGVSM